MQKFRRVLWSRKADTPSQAVMEFLWRLTKARVDYKLKVNLNPGWEVRIDLWSWIRNNLHR